MDWDAIGAVGELVGAVAVVATLVYLSSQLRQNTKALRSSTWQAIQSSEHEYDMHLNQDTELLDIVIRGYQGREFLTSDIERFRFELSQKQLLDQFHNLHYQYELGMVDEEWWQSWILQIREAFMWPGFREVAEARKQLLRPSFQTIVDDLLKEQRTDSPTSWSVFNDRE